MQTVLLLHGAIGSSAQLLPLAQALSNQYDVRTVDFSGHGGKPMPDQPFSIALFAKDVLDYIEMNSLSQVSVFGYSMGGYVGMYLAKHHPDKLNKLVTLATKFHWDGSTSEKEARMLVPEKILEKLPSFAQTLGQRHAPADWKQVLNKTATMLLAMGANNPLRPEEYAHIVTPSLILLGDRDKMVTLEETVEVYKALPAGQMGMLPATPHAIEQVNLPVLTDLIKRFIV
jgi:pimeloyl-ACP methyl ester carboxylesterase